MHYFFLLILGIILHFFFKFENNLVELEKKSSLFAFLFETTTCFSRNCSMVIVTESLLWRSLNCTRINTLYFIFFFINFHPLSLSSFYLSGDHHCIGFLWKLITSITFCHFISVFRQHHLQQDFGAILCIRKDVTEFTVCREYTHFSVVTGDCKLDLGQLLGKAY